MAIVYAPYVDAVIRSLGELGIVHLANMREEEEGIFSEIIEDVKPSERLYKCSNMISRVDRLFEFLNISEDEIASSRSADLTKSGPLEEENRLDEIEEKLNKLRNELQEFSEKKSELEVTDENRPFVELMELVKQLEIAELSKESGQYLTDLKNRIMIEKKIEETKLKLKKTSNTFIINGWVPVDRAEEVVKAIENAAHGFAVIEKTESVGGTDERT